MRILSSVCSFLLIGLTVAPTVQSQDIDPCDASAAAIGQFLQLRDQFFEGISDIDGDGLTERASLELVEAVACLNAGSDMADATMNAYNMNLAVFDLESGEGIDDLTPFREAIAMLMLVGADVQAAANGHFGDILTGTYERVQCTSGECTPDPVEEMSAREMVNTLVIGTRATDEPYTGTGDLDGDGTNNATEYNNVIEAGGTNYDFVVAATSPDRDGTEEIRTPGGGGSGGCFIATAAYGTPMAAEVDVLRTMRDNHLLTTTAGTVFVDTYYRLSPMAADVIAGSPALRSIARAFLYPVLLIAYFPGTVLGVLAMVLVGSWARTRDKKRRQRINV